MVCRDVMMVCRQQKRDLRDELAQLHLNDGLRELDLQQLRVGFRQLVRFSRVWREDAQHPHETAHYYLIWMRERV